MNITKTRLKQIIKEEIQALTEEDEMMAFNYLEKEFGDEDKANTAMALVYAAAEDLGPTTPTEEQLIELFKEMGVGRDDGAPVLRSRPDDGSGRLRTARRVQ